MNAEELVSRLDSSKAVELFSLLYGKDGIEPAQKRYRRLIEEFPEPSEDLRVFSVPGRTELGGNHTDHIHLEYKDQNN